MNDPHDPNRTVDVSSVPADSLDAGLAAGFGRPVEAPCSSLDASQRPALLREAQGESDHVVKPNSDAMPPKSESGDRYQLFGEIARGGMGAVLRGRDVDLGRDLAVKVLLEKHADNPAVARRFLDEAQIGGQLQHPGVVPVYDIGRFGDRPFFTMKLVKGHTLAALLAERSPPVADAPGSPAELPRFLGIALQVAQALAYAHAKGVIHRDLKPANIMAGAFGEVQVVDWGLAKVLAEGGVADEERASRERQRSEEGTLIRTARSSGTAGSHGTDTEAGSLLGTPAYMPPEQANGDIASLDRRCDVFGLGAILCEVLTGKPPYVGRSAEEVQRKAANGDLADAQARLDVCRADAELLALTRACLSPEAIDRPKDARAVADALTAYLDGVQERLHKAELAEAAARARATEEVKRRRLTVVLAATVLLALTLGGGGGLWVKADRDARQTALTRDVNEALNRATALREQAKAALVGSAALFAQTREQAQRALALVQSGPADAVLTAQVWRLQTELNEEEKDRQLLAALDAARLVQAENADGENRFASERAVPLFREALKAYGLKEGTGKPEAAAERIRGRPQAVQEAVAATLDEWIDLVTDPSLKLAEQHLKWLKAVAALVEPAEGWTRAIRVAGEEKDPTKRREALEKLADAADVRALPPLALTRLAWQLRGRGAGASAVRLLRRAQEQYPGNFWVNHRLGIELQWVTPPERDEAVRFLTAAVALRPDSPGAHLNLGLALKDKGQLDEAMACWRKALELDSEYVAAHCCLGLALRTKGLLNEAVACYRMALEREPKNAYAHNNLGITLVSKGLLDEGIVCFRKALELDPNQVNAHNSLGFALASKGLVDEAIPCYRKAIELDPKHVNAHSNLGFALAAKGRLDEAIACYRKVVELIPKDANARHNLGAVLNAKGQLDEAIACYRKALERDPMYVKAHFYLGTVLHARGLVDEAIACYRRAVELDPKNAFGQSANAYYNLGVALKDKGQLDEAIACYRKAIELDPRFPNGHNNLGSALKDKGQVDEAIACYRKAIELDPKHALARKNLGRAKRIKAVRDELPAFQGGGYTPATNEERLGLAEWCQVKKLHHTAASLYAAAFAADPQLADDLDVGHRYEAACNAALAAAGQGEDAGKLDRKERIRLCNQALTWLRADLALLSKQVKNGTPAARASAQQKKRDWQKDSDLAGIRDLAALAKLPAEERKACTRFWADVATLLKTAETPIGKETKP